jgi:hypothetical protein
MKSSSHPFSRISAVSRRQKRGIALIIVLACLALLVVMIVAFLGSIGSEVQTSKFYANEASVKLLAQSTTDLVMAEIRDATSDGSLCWASQPGMIRTWDNSGSAKSYYKLYSDSVMTGTGVFDHTQALVPDGTSSVNGSSVAWYKQQGVYVDLNQPVSVNGVDQYPIIDGDASSNDLTSSSTVSPSLGVPTAALVLGPLFISNLGATPTVRPQVDGFWVNSPSAGTTPTPVNSSSPNQVPMPTIKLQK